ncbi:hypothetical protein GCM10007036_36300 [Alsobacter metallidurans]|uniref:Uncharacterized protein n=2 Tax=Alsobacter metallidurans TaxID=340221 RepID=A0A917IAE1_9HYPH|nr:hypothetical protein GCM10007036_36300 [Alsobacter metallidurans]
MLYQPVSANELENYWQKVNEVKRAILSKSLKEDFTVTEKHYGLFDQTAMVSGNKTVEAVKALADGGSWPADYLFKYGSFSLDGCGKNIFGFVAVPRKLFVLVAIVKAERASVSIDGVDYLADKGGGLRTQINETESVRDRFPEQTISKDRSLIIPLRLDLRYDLDEEPISRIIENKLSIAQQRAITKIPNSVFSAVIGGRTIAKSKDSFGQPQFMQVNRAYTSGEARSLQSIVVDGTSYPVKPAPRTALVSVGELDGGSCPFLMVKESDGDWSLQGRVLVGANQRSLARSEAVKLPVDTSDIRIEEREPEITYISTIKIRYSGLQEAELASSVILQPGESLSLKLPRAADNETTLMLTGYYRTTTD